MRKLIKVKLRKNFPKKAKINTNIKPLRYSKKKVEFNYSLLKNQKKIKEKNFKM